MGFNGDEYAFESHEAATKFIHAMQENLASTIPQTIWQVQTEQLRSALRNHVETLGRDTDDEEFMHGLLYGALLTINLQAQSTEIAIPTAMLVTVMLDMIEHPSDLSFSEMEAMRTIVDKIQQRPSVWSRVVRLLIRIFA